LIQHEINLSKNQLIFRIYGTPDGRVVKMEKPVLLSQTPPPEPQYVDDGNYRKGQVIQVEHATWGAVVSAKRTVTKGDAVLYDDTFISRYQPWRAVYLRGTK
jgi:vancomycin resistance protein YoaR